MTKIRKINKIIEIILNILFPKKCGICDVLSDKYLCKKCEIKLNDIKLKQEEIEENQEYFNKLIYFVKYEGIIRKSIIKYKFKDKTYLYNTFCEIMLKDKKMYEIMKIYDTIIPVPISTSRMKKRGYNQTELIAKELARIFNCKLEKNVLIKYKNTIEQNKLNKIERQKNIKDVYKLINKELIRNNKILLVDDIYTTGNTVRECCKILKNADIKLIDVLVIAKD